jgi:hypothetical protein
MTVSTFPSVVVDFGTSVAIERAKHKQSADDLGARDFLHGSECEWPVGGEERYLAAMAQRPVATCAAGVRMDWLWGRRRRCQRGRDLPSGQRAHVRPHGQGLAGGALREQRRRRAGRGGMRCREHRGDGLAAQSASIAGSGMAQGKEGRGRCGGGLGRRCVCGALMMRESDFSLGGIEITPVGSARRQIVAAPESKRAQTLGQVSDRIARAGSTTCGSAGI